MVPQRNPRGAWRALALLALGYVGVYLCRKNVSVAMPVLQEHFHATKAEVGAIASAGTLAYAIGKVVNGPIVDRVGGRRGLLLALALVGSFGGASALAPSLGVLILLYSANRFAGSAAWGAALKLIPTWFRSDRTGTAVAALSLSYVGGSALATVIAARIVDQGGGLRAVLGLPALGVFAILAVCAAAVRPGPLDDTASPATAAATEAPRERRAVTQLLGLVKRPAFLATCALSFTLTFVREAFNTWSYDFLLSIERGVASPLAAGLKSTGFDLAGGVSIVAAGILYDRVRPSWRAWLMAGCLACLAVAIAALGPVGSVSPNGAAGLVALVGLLAYGPYSLLAGALAIDTAGRDAAATAAGAIDGLGYIAATLAGSAFGGIVDRGGYALGFRVLAGVTVVSAFLALGLRPKKSEASGGPEAPPRSS